MKTVLGSALYHRWEDSDVVVARRVDRLGLSGTGPDQTLAIFEQTHGGDDAGTDEGARSRYGRARASRRLLSNQMGLVRH